MNLITTKIQGLPTYINTLFREREREKLFAYSATQTKIKTLNEGTKVS